MLTSSQKIQYLLSSLWRLRTEAICPACRNHEASVIDRKAWITTLRECHRCGLYFRHPSDPSGENQRFYQDDYVEGDGITTFTPDEGELRSILEGNLADHPEKSAERILSLLRCLGKDLHGLRLVDFGSSWGYITHQFRAAGLDVQGYEISKPRAHFGCKHLGLSIETDVTRLRKNNDVFFSSHVIEHVPNPTEMLDIAKQHVLPDGLVITLCPNGSEAYRKASPDGFHRAWGKVHPNLLNAKYLSKIASDTPFYIASTPLGWQKVATWDQASQQIDDDMSGAEIMMIWKPHGLLSNG